MKQYYQPIEQLNELTMKLYIENGTIDERKSVALSIGLYPISDVTTLVYLDKLISDIEPEIRHTLLWRWDML